MTLYYVLRQHYRQHWLQLKCYLLFALLLLPLLVATALVQKYSSAWHQGMLLFTGWFIWTFIEYIMHRFWCHRKDADPANKLVHAHHHHHTHPTEIKVTVVQRLLMLLILVALSAISYYLQNYFTLFTGLCFGIAGYFTMHKVLHQPWAAKVFRRLFRYHIYHHCKYPNTCFGISVPWWDDVFRSIPKNPNISDRIIRFYLGHEH